MRGDAAISCAVLAGGESRRMGRDKAFVELDGRPLAVHVADRLGAVSDDVFVVAKQTERFVAHGVRAYADVLDVSSPLAGVASALTIAVHPHVFVCATDMPLVSCALVELLASSIGRAVAVVPLRDGRPEPLHAVWSTSARDAVTDAITSGERAVHRVLERLDVVTVDEAVWRRIDPDGASFTNINTPAELRAVSAG